MFTESRLHEWQKAVLENTTALAKMSGLAVRYSTALRRDTEMLPHLGTPQQIETALEYMQAAYETDAPFAFELEPSNFAVSVNLLKVDPETGIRLPRSSVQLGLLGGLARTGRLCEPFARDDLTFARDRLTAQRDAKLFYGLRDSVFLGD